RTAHLAFALAACELGLELRDPVANAAAIELERRFAGAAAHAPLLAAGSFAQPRRRVGEARDFDFEARFATARVAMEDLDDHPGSIERRDAGRSLEVAELARGDLVVHGDERDVGVWRAFGVG